MEMESQVRKSLEEKAEEQKQSALSLSQSILGGKKLTSGGLDLEAMIKIINMAFPKIESARGENVVLVLGSPGAGKSTTVNYLLGCDMQKVQDVDDFMAVPVDEKQASAKMGNSTDPITFYPEAYKSAEGLVYLDCPGFGGDRIEEERICESLHTQIAVRLAKSVQSLMIVIDIKSLTEGRGKGLKNLFMTLGKLLNDPGDLGKSMLFVVTKTSIATKEKFLNKISSVINSEEAKLEKTKKNFDNNASSLSDSKREKSEEAQKRLTLLKLMQANPDNIVLINVFDQGQHRKEIVDHLRKMQPIDKKTKFNFNQYSDEMVKFNEVIFNIARTGWQVAKQGIELPSHIKKLTDELKELETRIKFYDKQIEDLKTGKKTRNPQEEKQWEMQKNKNEESIRNYLKAERNLDAEIEELRDQKEELDTDEPTLHWNDKFEYQPARGWFTNRSHKLFVYKGLPFVHAKPNKDHGEFFERECFPEQGEYRVFYQPGIWGFLKTCNANVDIYVKKRLEPKNQLRIEVIKSELANKSEYQKLLQQQIEKLQDDNKMITGLLTIRQEKDQKSIQNQIQELQSGKRQFEEEKKRLPKKISQMQAELEQVKLTIQENQTLFEIIKKIASVVDFNSSVLDEFLYQFTKLISKTNELKPDNVPDEYLCKISLDIMNDPVSANCGHTFDRMEILTYLNNREKVACPCCKKDVYETELKLNLSLKQAIDNWKLENSKKSASPSLSQSRYSAFYKKETQTGHSLEIKHTYMDNLRKKLDEIEIQLDRLTKEQAKVTREIEVVIELKSLIEQAKKSFTTENLVTIIFNNYKLAKEFQSKFLTPNKEIKSLGDSNNSPHSIDLKFDEYNMIMGDEAFAKLLQDSQNPAEISSEKQEEDIRSFDDNIPPLIEGPGQ